jgi:hypothetical protein
VGIAKEINMLVFKSELQRKERMISIFQELTGREYDDLSKLHPKNRKYGRMVTDYGFVDKIEKSSFVWLRDNGEKFRLPATEKLCRDFTLADQLKLSIGLRNGQWRIIALLLLLSPMPLANLTKMERPKFMN